MKLLRSILAVCMFSISALILINSADAEKNITKKGPYQVVEGRVTEIRARLLIIDGQQYPVSMFVRVFMGSEKGQEIPMHVVVGIGKIDKARLLLLGGKVEKIIVLENL